MKKFILLMLFAVLMSCTATQEAHRDDYMYEKADPTEIIDVRLKSQKEAFAEEKRQERFSFRHYYETVIHNRGPNRFIPEFPELFKDDNVNKGNVFSF